jgi:hypothetical protein
MIQRPNAVGLMLCQQVIIEEKTRNVTLVNNFTRLQLRTFPSRGQQFVAHAMLTDGLGEVNFGLHVSRVDTLEEIALRSWRIRFTDPLRQVHVVVRLPNFSFPAPGRYAFSLEVEREEISECVLTVD